MKNLISSIYEHLGINTDTSKMNIDDIPIDANMSKTPSGYVGIAYRCYKYFGDCKNTVDGDNMWDATQMSEFIQRCNIIEVNNVVDILQNGDRSIPKQLTKEIDKLKANNKINDLSEICAGIDSTQAIMFIYLMKTDTHYFFDCIK